MKALKLLALVLILIGVVGSASAHTPFINTVGVLCGSSNDPSLCDQSTGEDLACTEFCDASCNGFINVTANCVSRPLGGYTCKCHGTPVP
jgi:hypothetical protein